MGVFHLHGIVPGGTEYRSIEPSHDVLNCGPVNALISETSLSAQAGDLLPEDASELAIAHNQILCAYCADIPVLPMRLGSFFSSRPAICAAVLANAAVYETVLQDVFDLREFAIRIDVVDSPEVVLDQPESGRSFLAQKRAARNKRQTLQQQQVSFANQSLAVLQDMSDQLTSVGQPRAGRMVNVAGLFGTGQIGALLSWTATAAPEATGLGLQLNVSGAWPLYSFDLETGLDRQVRHGC